MYLIHVGNEIVSESVNGKLYTFPPNEPVEIQPDQGQSGEFIGQIILDHMWHTGLVEVPVTKSPRGISFDVETARKQSAEKLKAGRKKLVDQYIQTQLQDRIKQNLPAVPPAPAIQKIIEEDGIDLGSYGIKPVGWKVDYKNDQSLEIESLRKETEALKNQLQLLLAALGGGDKPGRKPQ